MAEFWITLEAARVNARLTQAEAAKKLGISRQTLINWESPDHKPKEREILAAAALYKIPAEFFLK